MGNQRLGVLPRTRKWQEVVGLLDAAPGATDQIAAAVVDAADNRLRQLASDTAVGYSFWLLAQVTWAARSTNFLEQLQRLGFSVSPDSSAVEIIAQVGERIKRQNRAGEWTGYFGDFAALSVQSTLTNTVAQLGPGLFSSGLQDAQRAFRTYSTEARFGDLARRFFAGFMSRTMGSFVDREVANHVGPDSGFRSVSESRAFVGALDTHTWEAAAVVQRFAGEWYSKNNWQTRGNITRKSTQGFVAQALRKLRSELKRGA